jgi:hypothetical protein
MKYLLTVPIPIPWEAAKVTVEDALVEEEKAAAEAVVGHTIDRCGEGLRHGGFPAAAVACSRAVLEGSKLD